MTIALLLLTITNSLTSAQISFPSPSQLPQINELPDPFRFINGTRVSSPSEWNARRQEIAAYLQHYEYGQLPPPPTSVTGTRNGNTLTVTVQANGRTASFNATLRLPSGNGPFPAIILLNSLAASATTRGYAEVSINPPDIAADSTSKTGAFWTLYNGTGVDTGVLMAWAWGVHRTLDALSAVPQIDTSKVGVSGYSRYGKAALVAGAFDERIALTVPGSSGTAGMGDYRFFFTNGTNDETLNDIANNEFPYWFTPLFGQFGNQVTRLPFDQHSLAALVAPRPLLATNGTEGTDIRTNPQGAGLTYRGAKMVYQFLGVPDRIGIAYRPGGHQIDINDYNAIMDFADKYVKGLAITRTFDSVPYPPPTTAQIPWTIPSSGPTLTPTRTPTPGTPTVTPTPTNTPMPSGNLLTNGNIESGTTGWAVFGSGTLAANTSVFHGGTRSLLITGRTAAWNGPSQNVTSKLTNGKSYTTNVWVRTQSGAPSGKVTLAMTVNGSTSFITLAPARAVNSSAWTLLSGTATVSWSGTLSSATFYVETSSGTDSFSIDDASFQ